MRPIGTLLSGRALARALTYALSHRETAGEVPLTPHGRSQVKKFEEMAEFIGIHTAKQIPVFGSTHVPPFGVPAHERTFAKLMKVAERLRLVGVVAPLNEEDLNYLELPLNHETPVYLRNGFGLASTERIAGLCALSSWSTGLALDVGKAWMQGEQGLFAERSEAQGPVFDEWVRLVAPHLEVMIFDNVPLGTAHGGGLTHRCALMAGQIPPRIYVRLLTVFPDLPILVHAGSPLIAEMDIAILRHMEAQPLRYLSLAPGSGPHAAFEGAEFSAEGEWVPGKVN